MALQMPLTGNHNQIEDYVIPLVTLKERPKKKEKRKDIYIIYTYPGLISIYLYIFPVLCLVHGSGFSFRLKSVCGETRGA